MFISLLQCILPTLRILAIAFLLTVWLVPGIGVTEAAPVSPQLPPDEVAYVIITTEELVADFEVLADFWAARGYATRTVSTAWIQATVPPGRDLAESIRNFLQLAHAEWGLEHVLLGGDAPLVPPRLAHNTFYPPSIPTDIPADIYYACLDGDWDADGDGIFGEAYVSPDDPGDEADLEPELAVGRAPVNDASEAAAFVTKTIAFATAGSTREPTAALLGEVLFPQDWLPGETIIFDGAEVCQSYATLFAGAEPRFSIGRYYENLAADPEALPLTKANVLDAMNSGSCTLFFHVGHGYLNEISVGDGVIGAADAAALRNGVPFFLGGLTAQTGAFDFDCLLEEFLRNPNGGASACLGSSRAVFPLAADEFEQVFFREVVAAETATLGTALKNAWIHFAPLAEFNNVERWTQQSVVLLGDPLLTIAGRAAAGLPEVPAPAGLVLYPSVPNPFNPITRISFRLPDRGRASRPVTVTIYDLAGRAVRTVLDRDLPPDDHEVVWDGRDDQGQVLPSGTYVVGVRAGTELRHEKVTLLK